MEAVAIFACVVCLVVGFVAGALVYRNNAKKIERELEEVKTDLAEYMADAEAELARLKELAKDKIQGLVD